MKEKPTLRAEQPSTLGHLSILELTDEKGEYCGKLLADMGAEVIRVEPPSGHPTRNIGPFVGDIPDPEKSLHFFHYNTNKRSITLNIERPEGRTLFKELITRVDMLVESTETGYLEGLGLGYSDLKQVNAGLVMVSISGWGRTGPRAHYKSSEIVGWGASGYMYTNGFPHTPPTKPWGFQAYTTACLYGAIGGLSALFYRRATGQGQQVDISIQEAVASTVEHNAIFYIYDHIISKRRNNDHVNSFGGLKILRCKDGWAHLMMGWREGRNRIVEWMAEEGMAEDLTEGKYLDRKYQRAHMDHIVATIQRWALTKTRAELFHEGQKRGAEIGPLNTVPEVLIDPQLQAREYWYDLEHPELGKTVRYSGVPYRFSKSPCQMRRRAPLIGEDNEAIYLHTLGLSKEELTRLKEWKVI